VQRPVSNYILWVSVVGFAILAAGAVAISVLLATSVDTAVSNLGIHAVAIEAGIQLDPSDYRSTSSIVAEINGLRPITYWVMGGALGSLVGATVAMFWINRQLNKQRTLAIQRAELADELRASEESEKQRNRELESLFSCSSSLASSGTFEEKAHRIVDQLSEVADSDWATIRLPDETDQSLRLLVAAGAASESAPPLISLTGAEKLAGKAFNEGRVIVVNDYPAEPGASPAILSLGMESMVLIPIHVNGRTLGLVNVLSRRTNNFPADLVRLLTAIVDGIGPLIENARLEDQQKRAAEKIHETARLASIGELAAGVAHEVNNPLTTVLGYSQMMLDADIPEAMKGDLQIVVSETRRAAEIIRNLQLFARKSGPNKKSISVNGILERALKLKRHEFEKSNIRVNLNLSSNIPDSMIDEQQLVQVFVNILTNAQQAMEASQVNGQIFIRSVASGGKVEITIWDNGPGIPAEDLRKIFEPFFTTKDVGLGTGLGLSICHGIVHEHGGKLWAESTEGKGSTFHIEIPVWSGEVEEDVETVLPSVLAANKHILAVDDEPGIRNFIQKCLEKDSLVVDLAEDGVEAWRMLQSASYDCILLDIKMPRINGLELYELIRNTDEAAAKKVIFITGDTATLKTQDFVDSTGNAILHKPFQIDDLRSQIGRLLETVRPAVG